MRTAYQDRREAGRVLASRLEAAGIHPRTIVLALPRGGVEVGLAVAERLGLALDVVLVRKLGVPGYDELAMGAIASGGLVVRNPEVVQASGVSAEEFDAVRQAETRELERREFTYRGDRPPLDLTGRDALIVDDGVATGATMRVAVAAVRTLGPDRVIVAAPVGSATARDTLEREADLVVFDQVPEPFRAVGLWYDSFPQLGDRQVRDLLARSTRPERQPNGRDG